MIAVPLIADFVHREARRHADDLPDDWDQRDAVGSYYVAVAAIGERVKAGDPVPRFFRSLRTEPVREPQP